MATDSAAGIMTWSLRKSFKKSKKLEAKKEEQDEGAAALSGWLPRSWTLRRRWWRSSSLRKLRIAEFQIFQLIHRKIIDKFVFKVMYVAEAVVLVSTLCFFYVVCGGRL